MAASTANTDETEADCPILCETCLGPNPFIRMTKQLHGAACKICERAFTTFRWKPGPQARYKNTQICRTCAKLKNVCQTCILDLQYGLPVQVRDHALADEDKVRAPVNDINRTFMMERLERQLAEQGDESEAAAILGASGYGKSSRDSRLKRLRSGNPYYDRNRAHLCTYFARGKCNRGDECPYRHEMPKSEDDPLAKQNIKDRYYGKNDPVAAKLMKKMKGPEYAPSPPQDRSITTIWVGNLHPQTSDADIRRVFYTYGDITDIRVVASKTCAFVVFAARAAAEAAIKGLYGDCTIRGAHARLNWGKRQFVSKHQHHQHRRQYVPPVGAPPGMSSGAQATSAPQYAAVAPPPGLGAPRATGPATAGAGAAGAGVDSDSKSVNGSNIPPPPGMVPAAAIAAAAATGTTSTSSAAAVGKSYYPSMDPRNLGARIGE
jgi:pre-mRNA-splicing factor RBM22/SLT11